MGRGEYKGLEFKPLLRPFTSPESTTYFTSNAAITTVATIIS